MQAELMGGFWTTLLTHPHSEEQPNAAVEEDRWASRHGSSAREIFGLMGSISNTEHPLTLEASSRLSRVGPDTTVMVFMPTILPCRWPYFLPVHQGQLPCSLSQYFKMDP